MPKVIHSQLQATLLQSFISRLFMVSENLWGKLWERSGNALENLKLLTFQRFGNITVLSQPSLTCVRDRNDNCSMHLVSPVAGHHSQGFCIRAEGHTGDGALTQPCSEDNCQAGCSCIDEPDHTRVRSQRHKTRFHAAGKTPVMTQSLRRTLSRPNAVGGVANIQCQASGQAEEDCV